MVCRMQERSRILLGTLLLLAVILLGTGGHTVRAESQPLLTAIAHELDNARTIHGSFTTSISSQFFNGTVNSELWKQSPQNSRNEIHQSTLTQEPTGTVTISNGKQLWYYNPQTNIVYTGPVSTSATPNNGLNSVSGTGNDLLQTLFALVQGIFEQGQGTLKADTSHINGHNALVIGVAATNTAQNGNVPFSTYSGNVYIDQQTHLPLSVELTIPNQGTVSMHINSLELNASLTTSTFTFTPPAGASVQPLAAENSNAGNTTNDQITLAQAEKQADYHLLSIPGDQGQYQLSGVTLLGTSGDRTYALNYRKGSQQFMLAEGKPLANLPLASAGQPVQIQGQNGMLYSDQGTTTIAWTQQNIGLRLIGPLASSEEQSIANMLN
jgi:Outer membrane lipoprotein-sorting protein